MDPKTNSSSQANPNSTGGGAGNAAYPSYTQEQIHNLRKEVDSVIKSTNVLREYKGRVNGMREVKLAYTKLQEAKMWLGKVLEEIGSELPAQYRDEALPVGGGGNGNAAGGGGGRSY